MMSYSSLDTFFSGLEGRVGAPSPKVEEAMEHDHCEEADSKDEFTTSNYQLVTTPQQEYAFVAAPDSRTDWPLEGRADGWDDVRKRWRPLSIPELQQRVDGVNGKLEALGEPLLLMLEAVGGRLYAHSAARSWPIARRFGPTADATASSTWSRSG